MPLSSPNRFSQGLFSKQRIRSRSTQKALIWISHHLSWIPLPEKPSQSFSDGAPSSSAVVSSAVGCWQVLLVRSRRWWKHSRLSAFVGSGRSSGVLPFSSLLRCTFLLFLLFSHTDGYWVESVQLSEGLLWGKCWLACLRTVCFVAVVVVGGLGWIL